MSKLFVSSLSLLIIFAFSASSVQAETVQENPANNQIIYTDQVIVNNPDPENRFLEAESLAPDRSVVLVDAENGRALVEKLRDQGLQAWRDRIMTTDAVGTDPFLVNQWHLNPGSPSGAGINAKNAWSVSTGENIRIAILDTGVSLHPDLNMGSVNPTASTPGASRGWDYIGNDPDPSEEGSVSISHGTLMAGTAAAIKDNAIGGAGVAPEAKIVGMRVGNQGSIYTSQSIKAIYFGYAQGIRIFNMSYGAYIDQLSENDPEYQAIKKSPEAFFAASAGNEGNNLNATADLHIPCEFELDNLLCVAATSPDRQLAGFSNYGGSRVEIAAPGVNIVSTESDGTYAYVNGTSPAAAVISGAAALVYQHVPEATGAWVKQTLLQTAQTMPLANKVVGNKVVDARAAAWAAANLDETDLIPPETTITSLRQTKSGATYKIKIAYSSSKTGSRFECKINQENWTECNNGSWEKTVPVADNQTVYVRAIDEIGNVDPSPAAEIFSNRSVQINPEKPTVKLTDQPRQLSNQRLATFKFNVFPDSSSTICRLYFYADLIDQKSCLDQIGWNSLKDGKYKFEIEAFDPADPAAKTVKSYTWKINTKKPWLFVAGIKKKGKKAVFRWGSNAKTFRCKLNNKPAFACRSPWTVKALRKGKNRLIVLATSVYGNTLKTVRIVRH